MRRLIRRTAAALAAIIAAIVIWCLVPLKPTMPPVRPRSDTQYWTMSRGYRIAFTHVPRDGSLARPPIIFLHGGPGGYVRSAEIRLLGQLATLGHDVYLYDQVGSGLSDRRPRPKDYSFLGHVADLHEIVTRHLGARQVILIGHSYGGMVATQFAAAHPDLVDRLVLSSPGTLQPARFDEDGHWINERLYVPPAALRFIEPKDVAMDGFGFWPMRVLATMALATTLNVKLMPDGEADAALNTLATKLADRMVCDPRNVQAEEGGMGMYAHGWSNYYGDLADPRPTVRRVAAPVLVLQGACDYIPYASTYEYVELFPNAQYVFVEGAGHMIWWEQPALYVERIAGFLDRGAQR